MLRFKLNIAIVFLLTVSFIPATVYSQKKVKTIVMFFSWNANTPAFQHIIEGVRNSLSEEGYMTCNLLTEYLDLNRSPNEDYLKGMVNLYNEKYGETTVDALILVGPLVYETLKTYGLKFLETSPTLLINNEMLGSDATSLSAHKNQLRINLDYDFTKTFSTAFELFPDYKDVYLISGVSDVDEYFTEIVRNETKEFGKSHNFIFISGLSIDSTLQYVDNIPPNSIVFVVNFQLDAKNVPFTTPEVIGMVAKHSKAPVMMLVDIFKIEKGGLGGYVFSYTEVGKEIGQAVKKILAGSPVSDIAIDYKKFYQYAFDFQELRRWRLLNSGLIPDDIILYGDDRSFFARHIWLVVALVMFLLAETTLLLYLIQLNKKQKIITRRMSETESMYRYLIREDRLAKMTELTASLSHELNQPLAAILLSAQAGKRFLQSDSLDSALAGQIFDNIIEDDKRAGGIISSVRNLMKIEHREKEKTDINATIMETVELVRNDATRHNIKIVLTLESDPVFVLADKIQLQQVIINFIRNSEIAMENNDPENKKLEIFSKMDKTHVTITVRDSGPGISSAIFDKVFKPFVTDRKGGLGIGLALSRSIIESHDGSIWAENIAGGGAAFSFRLPILKNE